MGHLQEIDALQRWVFEDAGLKSMKLAGAPPTVARPVILWEHPRRGKQRNINRYKYTVQVQQYGKLFANSFDQAGVLEENLLAGIEERYGVLGVFEAVGSTQQIALLKNVTIVFSNSDSLDVPFTVTYEATYTRKRPVEPPHATRVGNKITTPLSDG
jgi:hypothetical protein